MLHNSRVITLLLSHEFSQRRALLIGLAMCGSIGLACKEWLHVALDNLVIIVQKTRDPVARKRCYKHFKTRHCLEKLIMSKKSRRMKYAIEHSIYVRTPTTERDSLHST